MRLRSTTHAWQSVSDYKSDRVFDGKRTINGDAGMKMRQALARAYDHLDRDINKPTRDRPAEAAK
jgi:hypothetical protein